MAKIYSLRLCGIVLGFWLIPFFAYCQVPVLLSHSPVSNTIKASLNAKIELTFSEPMSRQAGSDLAIRIVSEWRGQLPGSYTGMGSSTIVFTPTSRFLPAEPICVTVTALATSQAGIPVASTSSYKFITVASGASGQFTDAATVPIAPRVYGIALADVDNDGSTDMLTANISAANTGTVNLQFGNGKGGYRQSIDVLLGGKPSSIAVGDINKDGKLDFITTNGDVSTVSVRLGDGLGGFSNSAEVAVGQHPVQGLLQDFNQDGNLDLVTVSDISNAVSLRLGDGTGKFTLPITPLKAEIAVGAGTIGLAIQDVNRDGYSDLVAVGQPSGTGTAILSVRTGNGKGIFTGTTVTSLSSYVNAMAVQDVNADGNPDLLLAKSSNSYNGRGSVSIQLGDGQGSFSSSKTVSVNKNPTQIILGDFNRDGKIDLATAGRTSATTYSTVSVRIGDGAGSFTGYADYPIGSVGAVNVRTALVALADMNGDNNLDLVSVSNAYAKNATYTNAVMGAGIKFGDGQGNFSGPSEIVAGTTSESGLKNTVVADVNNDGNLDLLCQNNVSSSIGVRLNDGRGNFRVMPSIALPADTYPYSMAAGDLNSDGKLDFVTANYGRTDGVGAPAGGQSVSVRLGGGDGSFSGTTEIPLPTFPYQVVLSDINNDGKLDMLLTTYSNYNFIYVKLGDGKGGFTDVSSITDGVGKGMVLSVVDINNDGLLDLAVADQYKYNESVHTYLGDGKGGFKAKASSPGYGAPFDIATGDVNNDGLLDFVVITTYPALITYLGDGKGGLTRGSYVALSSFSPATNYVGDPSSITLADINSDGLLDAVIGALTSGTRIFSGDGKGGFAYTTNVPTGDYIWNVAACDMNNDGSIDLVASCNAENAVSVRLNTPQAAVLAVVSPQAIVQTPRLSVYPNPGKDNVKLENATTNSPVSLIDMTGRTVRSYPSTALPLNISALPPGLYLLRCNKQTTRLVIE
jgi:hypothetical protein